MPAWVREVPWCMYIHTEVTDRGEGEAGIKGTVYCMMEVRKRIAYGMVQGIVCCMILGNAILWMRWVVRVTLYARARMCCECGCVLCMFRWKKGKGQRGKNYCAAWKAKFVNRTCQRYVSCVLHMLCIVNCIHYIEDTVNIRSYYYNGNHSSNFSLLCSLGFLYVN
jgi:hypothetical protein